MDMDAQLQMIANHLGTEVVQLSQRDLTPEVSRDGSGRRGADV